jgi:glycosyltransferase involved in cell wall biosynthesis
MGKPVITTDSVGCRDTVEDGVTGWLVGARDVQALVGSMSHLLRMPHEQAAVVSLRARQRILAEFDEQIVLDAYGDAISGTPRCHPQATLADSRLAPASPV